MRLIFMGTPDFSVPALNALVAAGHDIAAVYCQPPRPAGRGKHPRQIPVETWARDFSLPVQHPHSMKDPTAQAEFAAFGAEAAVVVAYGLILPPLVLAAPVRGCLNINASLLPRWRGAAPIQRAIMAGDTETGVCIMQMAQGLDTGPVLMRRAIAIQAQDTAGDLHDRLRILGADMIVDTLNRIDTLPSIPQSTTGVTYAHKIDKAEARVDWTRPAAEVDRQIRGLSPSPGAWTRIGGKRVKFLRSRVKDHDRQGTPGQVLAGLHIACGTGIVEILTLQPEGKAAMPAAAYLHGTPVAAGVVLDSGDM